MSAQIVEPLAGIVRISDTDFNPLMTYEYAAIAADPSKPVQDFQLVQYVRKAQTFGVGSLTMIINNKDNDVVIRPDQRVILEQGKTRDGIYREFFGTVKSVTQFRDPAGINQLRVVAQDYHEILANRHIRFNRVRRSLVDGRTFDTSDVSMEISELVRDWITRDDYLIDKSGGPMTRLPIPGMKLWYFLNRFEARRDYINPGSRFFIDIESSRRGRLGDMIEVRVRDPNELSNAPMADGLGGWTYAEALIRMRDNTLIQVSQDQFAIFAPSFNGGYLTPAPIAGRVIQFLGDNFQFTMTRYAYIRRGFRVIPNTCINITFDVAPDPGAAGLLIPNPIILMITNLNGQILTQRTIPSSTDAQHISQTLKLDGETGSIIVYIGRQAGNLISPTPHTTGPDSMFAHPPPRLANVVVSESQPETVQTFAGISDRESWTLSTDLYMVGAADTAREILILESDKITITATINRSGITITWDNSDGYTLTSVHPATLDPDTLYHLAITFDGRVNPIFEAYVNGVKSRKFEAVRGSNTAHDAPFTRAVIYPQTYRQANKVYLHDYRIYLGVLMPGQMDLIRNNPFNVDHLNTTPVRLQERTVEYESIASVIEGSVKSAGMWSGYDARRGVWLNERYTVDSGLLVSSRMDAKWAAWPAGKKAALRNMYHEITRDILSSGINTIIGVGAIQPSDPVGPHTPDPDDPDDLGPLGSHNASLDLSSGDVAIPFTPDGNLFKVGFRIQKITDVVDFGIPITIVGSLDTDDGPVPNASDVKHRSLISRETVNAALEAVNKFGYVEIVLPLVELESAVHYVLIPRYHDPGRTVALLYQTGIGTFYRRPGQFNAWTKTTGAVNMQTFAGTPKNITVVDDAARKAAAQPRETVITLPENTETDTARTLLQQILKVKARPNTSVSQLVITPPATPLVLGSRITVHDDTIGDLRGDLIDYTIESKATDASNLGAVQVSCTLDVG